MEKLNKIKINGEFYVSHDYLKRLVGSGPVNIREDQSGNLVFNYSNITVMDNHNDDLSKNETVFTEEQIKNYWDQAANESRREIFMNTIRPQLKSKLGYDFSEIELEKKAKLLCAHWYYFEEKGEKYEGPYIIGE